MDHHRLLAFTLLALNVVDGVPYVAPNRKHGPVPQGGKKRRAIRLNQPTKNLHHRKGRH